MRIIFFLFLLLASTSYAQVNETSKVNSNKALSIEKLGILEIQKEEQRVKSITNYLQMIKKLDDEIAKEKVWTKSYASYLTSLEVRDALQTIKKRIKYLQNKRKKTLSQQDELSALISKEKILASQIEKLKEKDSAPFSKIITPSNIEEKVSITNPFDIFTGISLIKTLDSDFTDYIKRKDELTDLISILLKENNIYKEIAPLDINKEYVEHAKLKAKELEIFSTALDTMDVTSEVYQKRLEILEINVNKDIEVQVIKLGKIGVVVLVVFFIFFILKLFVKKYITDNERFYMANKIINFINFNIIIFILFFNYIQNASYLVTILGFASAGIAIAMKDWFMSILGWLVVVVGGSIHVGDRIRVDMDGMKYVGDVMDISLLRMTLLEDITLTAVTENRRAGRIIFVPNNYVFTNMIANYTHSSLKTVWDGVAITISFDSNHKKAMHLAKEIVKKYSKGYTDITRKQLNKLRSQYSLKNTNVEPRIFSFIEPNGVCIDSWYLTNAYATLTLRSVISVEIVEAFNKEDDITIAYPTQRLHIQTERNLPPFDTSEVI
ncbi:MAG: small-conductance mechanosensitive channel [Sulfurimonas sp.]|jgi:small-conductance mechanosensitive channel